MKVLVIIPTYNERQNIEKLLEKITSQNIDGLEILVIDDNSPDGTGDCVSALAQHNPRLHYLRREAKMGLGTAYVAGFRYALQRDYELIIEMDADFSHDPNELKNLIAATEKYDLAVGSRYINGVNVINWPLSRLLLSMGASLYTRIITGLPLHDCTSGFKCFKRQVLEKINLDGIKSDGYSFQIEMHFKAWKKGFKLGEIPIVFYDRTAGTSKMSKKIVHEAIWIVWHLKISSLTGKL